MASTLEMVVHQKLAEKGQTLRNLAAMYDGSVRLTWHAVLRYTGIEVSERTIRRWLSQ